MGETKAILFDFDGTLVRTQPIKIRSAQKILSKLWGMKEIDVEKIFLEVSGNSRRDLLNALSKSHRGKLIDDHEFLEISSEFSKLNLGTILLQNPESLLQPGVTHLLEELTQMRIPLFISSAAIQDEILEIARHAGIYHYFQEILGSDREFKKGKAHIHHIKKLLKVDSSELIFVGDEAADIRLNRPEGVRTFGVVWDRPSYREILSRENPEAVLMTLDEIKPYIRLQGSEVHA